MKKEILTIITWSMVLSVHASSPGWLLDAKSRGMGYILSVENGMSNPATNSLLSERLLFCNYSNEYFCHDLQHAQAGMLWSGKWLDYGGLLSYYGYSQYREINCGIHVSKLLKPGFSVGLRMRYFRLDYIDNQKSINRVTADIGLAYAPVNNFKLGLLLLNPFRVGYSVNKHAYHLPIYMALGLSYQPHSQVSVLAEVAKDIHYPLCLKGAVAYNPISILSLRIGILSSPFMPTFGVGLHCGHFAFDFACTFHPALGSSPSLGIKYFIR